jgi:hypothetical protein
LVCALGARRLGPARVLFLLGLAVAYSLMADGFEAGALKRYLFPVWVLCAMSARRGWAQRVERHSFSARGPTVKPAALVAALILLVQAMDCASLLHWDRATKPVASYVGACERLGQELDTVLAKDERVASFDSGSLGYFASRPVLNLDGLVNDDIPRMRSRCLGPYSSCLLRYLHEKRIAILIGGTAFGWTSIFPNWTHWSEVYASPPLGDGARVVALRIPD